MSAVWKTLDTQKWHFDPWKMKI